MNSILARLTVNIPGGIIARANALLSSSSAAFGLISFNPYTSFKINTCKMIFQTNFKEEIKV